MMQVTGSSKQCIVYSRVGKGDRVLRHSVFQLFDVFLFANGGQRRS